MGLVRLIITVLVLSALAIGLTVYVASVWEHEQHCEQTSRAYSAAMDSPDAQIRTETAQSLGTQWTTECKT
jgi:hypothetical protein